MPDTQIHPTGVVSAPGDYVIPGSAELLLKTAFARFDGSGAAGSFQPLLRIISDAGSVVAEAVSDTTVAAGESADATWFPHLAARPAAAAASPIVPIVAGRLNRTQTVPAGGAIDIAWDTVTIPSNSASFFGWTDVFPSEIACLGTATLLYALTVEPFDDWPAAGTGVIQFYGCMTHNDTTDVQQILAAYPQIALMGDSTLVLPTLNKVTSMGICVGQPNKSNWQATVRNTTAANWVLDGGGTAFVLARLNAAINV